VDRRDVVPGLIGGFFTGFAGGFFGVGGGVVLIPLLTGRFRLSQHQSHGTSLAVIGATSLVSIFVYAFHGNVAWLPALWIAAASLVTARYGARLAARTPPGRLTRIFAVFLFLVSIRLLLWSPPAKGAEILHGLVALGAFDVVLGLAVGLLSGYMGVGGGILIVPALTLLLGWPQQLAQGTSLAVILAVAPAGAIEHARHGNVVGRLVPILALGASLGGPIASWVVQGLDRELLTRAFAVFLMVNAVVTWIRAGRKKKKADEPVSLEAARPR
jgi:hypothetical protein